MLTANKSDIDNFDSIKELQCLTFKLKKEYFTPIEREDIYLLAVGLSNLHSTLNNLNTFEFQSNIHPAEILTLSNFLYSATEIINETVKSLSKFPKSDIFDSIFKIKELTEKAVKLAQNELQSKFEKKKQLIIDCINQCNIFADKLMYIYLKNT